MMFWFGIGIIINFFSIFVSFWMIMGSFFPISNMLIFISLFFYLLGLSIFDLLILSAKKNSIEVYG